MRATPEVDELGYHPVDRYLEPATVQEAATILRGLSQRLSAVTGTWADDAGEDAVRVGELARRLDAWCPRPVPTRTPGGLRVGTDHGHDWPQVLALYLTESPRSPGPCPPPARPTAGT